MAQERPMVLFLMETKNQEDKIRRLRRRLKFEKCFVVNPTGIRGGLAIMWIDSVEISIMYALAALIDIVCEEECRTKMRVTFVQALGSKIC